MKHMFFTIYHQIRSICQGEWRCWGRRRHHYNIQVWFVEIKNAKETQLFIWIIITASTHSLVPISIVNMKVYDLREVSSYHSPYHNCFGTTLLKLIFFLECSGKARVITFVIDSVKLWVIFLQCFDFCVVWIIRSTEIIIAYKKINIYCFSLVKIPCPITKKQDHEESSRDTICRGEYWLFSRLVWLCMCWIFLWSSQPIQ